MLSIQSIMLMALGFLTAALLALIFAPAVWSRAVRLTTQRIKERLPVTEMEIRADKDRLRAEFAMTVHRLETKIEQAELKRARHLIELNRRDANISALEEELGTLRTSLDEHENARRVLEHTVSERLPKVESRLNEARSLLATRDAEITQLSTSTNRQQQALEEARGINAQQGAEIDRLATSLTVRGGRNQEALNDPSVSGEIALRAELEGLRAKARDQAALIARMQQAQPARDGAASTALVPANRAGTMADVAASMTATPDEARVALERELRALKAKNEDQSAEIASLTAELGAMRGAEAANTPDSKVALRARLAGVQTQSEQQAELVRKLRAELAAANERLALQGVHFMEQMRRLSTATPPSNVRRSDTAELGPARQSLAERVANTRAPLSATGPAMAAEDVGSPAAGGPMNGDNSPAVRPVASPGGSRLIDRISSLGKV